MMIRLINRSNSNDERIREEMKKWKKCLAMVLTGAMMVSAVGCGASKSSDGTTGGAVTEEKTDSATPDTKLLIAAAASLEYSMKEKLIPMFEEENPGVTVEGTYDSSGKLQTQIEEGLEADLFFSAAKIQMDALSKEGYIDTNSEKDVLENKLVLIVPADSELDITKFEDVEKGTTIALGDPASVPVGQYSQEALTNLGIWDNIQDKVSLGTNVTEVLNWVAEGSADVGIVYATDAATTDKVKVIAEAPEGSLAEDVVYPAAVLDKSANKEVAQKFMDFLCSDEAAAVFKEYGFTPIAK